jgi:hypothetical protein
LHDASSLAEFFVDCQTESIETEGNCGSKRNERLPKKRAKIWSKILSDCRTGPKTRICINYIFILTTSCENIITEFISGPYLLYFFFYSDVTVLNWSQKYVPVCRSGLKNHFTETRLTCWAAALPTMSVDGGVFTF